jgi:TRAP-type C4-dicarboxylate transport system substrate-binding protein
MRIFGIASAGDYRSFANSKRRIRTPDDLKGLKFRTIPSKVQTEFVKTMGAMPTPVAWTELYTSLQTGVVDGTKNSIAEMVDMKFHEVLKYATIDNHSTVEMMWVINEKYRKSLPDDLRRALNSAAYFAQTASHGINFTFSERNRKIWLDSGAEIYVPTAEEKALFVKKAQPVYEWFRKKYENGGYWIDKLQKAIKESDARRDY